MTLHRPSLSARLVGAVAVATLTAAGVGAAGASVAVAAPVVVETTPPAPEPTTAPPAETPTPTTVPGEDSSDSTDWLPIVLVVVGVIALITILALAFGRRSPAPARPSGRPSSPESNLLSTSQWIHDQLTLELAAADPASARQRWVTERSRLDNVAIGAQEQWSAGHGDAWRTLSQTMSGLATAVDTNINLRNQSPPDATLIAESSEVVNRHRAALQQLITAMWPTVNR